MNKKFAYLIGGFIAGVIVIILVLVLLGLAVGVNKPGPSGGPGSGQIQPQSRLVQVMASYPDPGIGYTGPGLQIPHDHLQVQLS